MQWLGGGRSLVALTLYHTSSYRLCELPKDPPPAAYVHARARLQAARGALGQLTLVNCLSERSFLKYLKLLSRAALQH